jgi:hypothetical protein
VSERTQKVLVWWGCIFALIYGLALLFLLHMVPPPSPNWSADRVARFYSEHHDSIRVGAVIASWSSGFMVPLAIVVGIQMGRQEDRSKVWMITSISCGVAMAIFLMLPPLYWGVAAYTPSRAPEITNTMHELGVLTLTTTDQYYIFFWVGMVAISLTPHNVRHSPFPRWYGYFTAWTGFMFEAGAFAFLPRTGPFDWRGLLVFWSPLTLFTVWIAVTATLLLKALNKQIADPHAHEPLVPVTAVGAVA